MEKMKQSAFLDFQFLGNLAASPSKKRAAYTLSRANYDDNAYEHTLFLSENQTTTKLKKLGSTNQFVFLNDETLLVDYQKNKSEKTDRKENSLQTLYAYDLKNKTFEKKTTLPFVATIEEVLSPARLLISAQLTEADHILYEGDVEARKEYLKTKKKHAFYEAIDELPYYFNGRGFKTDEKRQLFIYDIETEQVVRLMSKRFSVGMNVLSDDKKTLYYTGKDDEKLMTFTTQVYAYDFDSQTHRTLYSKDDYAFDLLREIDGHVVVAAKDMKDYGINQNPDFYLLENNQLTLLASYGQSLGNTVGTDVRLGASLKPFVKAEALYFFSTIEDHVELRKLTLDGEIDTVFAMKGTIDGFADLNDAALLIGLHKQRLQELYHLDYSREKLTMVSRHNSRVLSNTYVATPRSVTLNKETHRVHGYVLLPKNYDPDQSYPAILNIHGGPKTVYGSVFYHEMQYWANEGYIVFFANPRGSDGKGNAFADIRGKYGTIDYEDLMDFTDLVLKRYKGIDTQRLFVTGGSYGGFMTNWIVGHTNRFKAAVTQRSISNWFSFYGTSDIGYFFASDQTDGHPLEDREKLFEQSPIKYARNIETPLLFIHADKDYRCPVEQAQQLYAILKHQGLPTKLVWIKDETHELSRSGKPQAREKRLQEITDWFKDYT